MEKIAITVPAKPMPKKDPEHPCACQDIPVKMKVKKGVVIWILEDGAEVEAGQLVCEGEVEKKTIEFFATESGVWRAEKAKDDQFRMNDVLGYIEKKTDEAKPIDIYLITGFLGAGKTTFIKNLLTKVEDQQIGIIVNEFGSVGVDAKELESDQYKIVEINNGSIFCACLKDGFRRTLSALLGQPINTLFIEASGMADPAGITDIINQAIEETDPSKTNGRTYSYGGNICLVNAAEFLDYYGIFTATQSQVKKSSMVILNKTDLVDGEKIMQLHQTIKELNPDVYIFDAINGEIPVDELFDNLNSDHLDGESENTPWNRPATYVIDMDDCYEFGQLQGFLQDLSPCTRRIKGYVNSSQGLVHVDGVGTSIKTNPSSGNDEEKPTCLVVIGASEKPYGETIEKLWKQYFPNKELEYEDE